MNVREGDGVRLGEGSSRRHTNEGGVEDGS